MSPNCSIFFPSASIVCMCRKVQLHCVCCQSVRQTARDCDEQPNTQTSRSQSHMRAVSQLPLLLPLARFARRIPRIKKHASQAPWPPSALILEEHLSRSMEVAAGQELVLVRSGSLHCARIRCRHERTAALTCLLRERDVPLFPSAVTHSRQSDPVENLVDDIKQMFNSFCVVLVWKIKY